MKKLFALISALALACACAPSATAAIAVNGTLSALIGENGATIIEPGVYQEIFDVRAGELFAAKDMSSGNYLLLNSSGEALSDADYSYFEKTDGGIMYAKGSKYGVMDFELNEIVPCEYTWIVPNGNGEYLALRTDIWDDSPDGVYLIDKTGYVSPTGVKVAQFLMPFNSGLSPAMSTENGRYGYLDTEGHWALRPQYVYAEDFINGLAIASLDSGFGVINERGDWVITPKHDYVSVGAREDSVIIGVNFDNDVVVYDAATFAEIFTYDAHTYGAYVVGGGDMIFVYADDGVSAVDAKGDVIMRLQPDALIVAAGDSHLIVFDGEWGGENAYVCDLNGNPVTPSRQNITYFGEYDGLSYFVFDEFDAEESETSEIIWYSDTITCGLMDEDGRELLQAEYTLITSPADGYVFAEKSDGMYLYDMQAREIWRGDF